MTKNKIGNIIRALRLHKNNCTQKVLADFLSIKSQTISQWENGKKFPRTKHIIQMAKFFHVSVDYLLGLKEYD